MALQYCHLGPGCGHCVRPEWVHRGSQGFLGKPVGPCHAVSCAEGNRPGQAIGGGALGVPVVQSEASLAWQQLPAGTTAATKGAAIVGGQVDGTSKTGQILLKKL